MLNLLLNVPQSVDDWNRFSWNLREEVRRCNQAILENDGISLPDLQLDPINFAHIYDWLWNVSQSVGAICQVTDVLFQDLFEVNLQDANARAAWIYTLFTELFDAEAVLQI